MSDLGYITHCSVCREPHRPQQPGWYKHATRAECITALRAALDQERATTLDLAMLVRRMELELRLIPQPRTERLRAKALDYLKRKGLSGSVLRSVADPALLSGRGEGGDPVAQRISDIDRQWQKQIEIRRGDNDG